MYPLNPPLLFQRRSLVLLPFQMRRLTL